jgi:CheY-like chemotaxis protein
VLVVDDDREIASIITDLLIDEGYEAFAVFDGQQALEHVEQHKVDLIVSDIRMPRLDGLALIRGRISQTDQRARGRLPPQTG